MQIIARTQDKKFIEPILGVEANYLTGSLADGLTPETKLIILKEDSLNVLTDLRQAGIGLPVILIGKLNITDSVLASSSARAELVFPEDAPARLNELVKAKLANTVQIPDFFLGTSQSVQLFRSNLQLISKLNVPVIIYGRPGTGKLSVMRYLANTGERQSIAEIDLRNYSGENFETHIWTALKDIFRVYPSPVGDRPLYNTLYLQGLESKDLLLVISLLEWLLEQNTSFGPAIRVIVGIEDKEFFGTIPQEFFKKYVLLEIPALAERREDLVQLIAHWLQVFNQRYQRQIEGFSTEAWQYLVSALWSGNIEELRYNLEAIFLASQPEKTLIELADLPITEQQLFSALSSWENAYEPGSSAFQALAKLRKG